MKTEKLLSRILYIGVPFVSIFLLDGNVSDPVNAPKLFALGVVSSAALSVFFKLNPKITLRKFALPAILLLIFLIFSVVTLLTSSAPFSQSLYGVYGRNNGFMTYLFLTFLFFSALSINSLESHLKISAGLLIAGLVNLIYCGWVLIFGDFLSWNNPYGNILGTFGNPNFIGSFFGICFGVLMSFILAPQLGRQKRLLFIIPIPVLLIEIYLSRAIQGRVLVAVGIAVTVFFWIRFNSSKILLGAYSLAASLLGVLALAGALQVGPLTSAIYKTSVSLRGQYWLSGWNTGNANPWNGAGFDSLGDWYRRMRENRALELPGVDTVVNTAHNVPLDVFAFGGWPLFTSYVLIMGLVGYKCIAHITKMKNYDPVFISLFTAWLCYQLQSIISINQIGLAVWGWLLSGVLLSYTGRNMHDRDSRVTGPNNSSKKAKSQEIISPQLVAGIAVVISSIVSVPPLSSDIKWLSAQKSGDSSKLEESMKPGYLNPANSYKYLVNVQIFERSNLHQLAHTYALEAVRFNPDYYDAWKLLSILKNSTNEDKSLALSNMRRLDPRNPELK